MSIADKLVDINNIKLDIKDAIEAKGVSMTGATFSDYPDKIALIPTGSTGGTTCTDSYIVSGFTGGTYLCVKQYLNFNNTTGFNSTVYALVIDSDGKIYVGGEFTSYKGVAANRIIRLNTDGSIDTDFDNTTGFNSIVYALVIDSNNKLYVGGNFITYKANTYKNVYVGVAANYVIRLKTDGNAD